MLRQTGGTERTLLLQFLSETEEGEVQRAAAFGKRPHKPWTLRLLSSMDLTGTARNTHIHPSATDRTDKAWAAQDNKNLAGESTPLLDGLTSCPELLELQILRNRKSLAGNSSLAVPGSFEVSLYGQY